MCFQTLYTLDMKKLFQKIAFSFAIIAMVFFTTPCKVAQAKPEDSFVQILFEFSSGIFMGMGTGSGSVIRSVKGGGYVLTAAHVCLPGVFQIKEPEPNDLAFINLMVLDGNNNFYEAEIYGFEIRNDLCLLFVKDLDLPALEIASRPPRKHEQAVNITAPLGKFGKDLMPYFEGHYLGTLYGSWFDVMEGRRMAVYSIPAAGGSSGSPVLNRFGRVVGMIHSVYPDMHHLSLSPTWKQIDQFLKRQLDDL